jgi:hypothetical protein
VCKNRSSKLIGRLVGVLSPRMGVLEIKGFEGSFQGIQGRGGLPMHVDMVGSMEV